MPNQIVDSFESPAYSEKTILPPSEFLAAIILLQSPMRIQRPSLFSSAKQNGKSVLNEFSKRTNSATMFSFVTDTQRERFGEVTKYQLAIWYRLKTTEDTRIEV